jgi:hypothetical protein
MVAVWRARRSVRDVGASKSNYQRKNKTVGSKGMKIDEVEESVAFNLGSRNDDAPRASDTRHTKLRH